MRRTAAVLATAAAAIAAGTGPCVIRATGNRRDDLERVCPRSEVAAVVQRAKELVEFARHHGYRLDELIEIIEDVG